jgi:hypothetical protein
MCARVGLIWRDRHASLRKRKGSQENKMQIINIKTAVSKSAVIFLYIMGSCFAWMMESGRISKILVIQPPPHTHRKQGVCYSSEPPRRYMALTPHEPSGSKIWSWVPWDSVPTRITMLARASSNLAVSQSVVPYSWTTGLYPHDRRFLP